MPHPHPRRQPLYEVADNIRGRKRGPEDRCPRQPQKPRVKVLAPGGVADAIRWRLIGKGLPHPGGGLQLAP